MFILGGGAVILFYLLTWKKGLQVLCAPVHNLALRNY